jgi:hypothetical protein
MLPRVSSEGPGKYTSCEERTQGDEFIVRITGWHPGILEVTQALVRWNPPIEFGSIEAGDFADGRRILALINFPKEGNCVSGERTKRNPLQIVNMVAKAVKTIWGVSSGPDWIS